LKQTKRFGLFHHLKKFKHSKHKILSATKLLAINSKPLRCRAYKQRNKSKQNQIDIKFTTKDLNPEEISRWEIRFQEKGLTLELLKRLESLALSVYRHSFLSELPETVHQMTKRETKLRLFAKQPQSFLFLYIGTVCAWAQDNGSPVSVCYVMGQRPRLGVEDNLYNHFCFWIQIIFYANIKN
jgi:hypothetical protein